MIQEITNSISNLQAECLHVVVDFWTNRQKKSCLGLKGRYVEDHKVKEVVLGVIDVVESQTAVNVKRIIESYLFLTLKIPISIVSPPVIFNSRR